MVSKSRPSRIVLVLVWSRPKACFLSQQNESSRCRVLQRQLAALSRRLENAFWTIGREDWVLFFTTRVLATKNRVAAGGVPMETWVDIVANVVRTGTHMDVNSTVVGLHLHLHPHIRLLVFRPQLQIFAHKIYPFLPIWLAVSSAEAEQKSRRFVDSLARRSPSQRLLTMTLARGCLPLLAHQKRTKRPCSYFTTSSRVRRREGLVVSNSSSRNCRSELMLHWRFASQARLRLLSADRNYFTR